MAKTLSETVNRLRQDITIDPNGGIFDDQQLINAINQALFRFQKDGGFAWSQNEKTPYTVSIVPGTQEYAIPADLVKIQLVRLDGEVLTKTDKLTLKSQSTSFNSGKPGMYYTRGGNIGLNLIPTSGTTLEIDYLGMLDILENDADVIPFPDQHIQAILKYAAYLIWSNPRGDESTAAARYADYQNELATLMSAYSYDTANITFNVQR